MNDGIFIMKLRDDNIIEGGGGGGGVGAKWDHKSTRSV